VGATCCHYTQPVNKYIVKSGRPRDVRHYWGWHGKPGISPEEEWCQRQGATTIAQHAYATIVPTKNRPCFSRALGPASVSYGALARFVAVIVAPVAMAVKAGGRARMESMASRTTQSAFIILRTLDEYGEGAMGSMVYKDIIDRSGLKEEAFEKALLFLLQSKYINGSMGRWEGSCWMTATGRRALDAWLAAQAFAPERQALEKVLVMAQRALMKLEEQAAGYSSLSRPVELTDMRPKNCQVPM
jgi:hypothetical protein